MTLSEIKELLKDHEPPTGTIQIKQGEYIKNARNFIDSHIATLERYPKNRTFLPHYQRLKLYV